MKKIQNKTHRSLYEVAMGEILKKAGLAFETEYRFDKKRRWRFDFCLKPMKTKIAIEIEGGTWAKSRHGFGKGFQNDCEKYNAASLNGWIILRYTPDTLSNVLRDLKNL